VSSQELVRSGLKYLIIALAFLISSEAISQNLAVNSYSVRFRLATLDTSTNVACYDIQLMNPGTESWRLFAYNFNLFYDASVASFLRDSVVSEQHVSESEPISRVIPTGTVVNSGLTYDSIGFLRLSVSEIISGEGQVFEPNSDWISISQICFFIDLDDITNPTTCLSINFGTPQIRAATGARPDIVQETDVVTISRDLLPVERIDVFPDRTLNSCFVLDEDTEDLCSDGIDNDEDGLLDCDDPSCSPDVISVERVEIECISPTGSISIVGGSGEGILYSIDGGASFVPDSIFEDLEPGIYDVVVIRNDVSFCAFANTVILSVPDCSETDDIACTDGLDNDGDGLIDCADENCQPPIEALSLRSPAICPNLNDGQIEVSSLLPDAEFSIDSGMTYQVSGVFDSIVPGIYHVFIRNTITMCEVPSGLNPIEITPGISCQTEADLPSFFIPNVINPNTPPQNLLSVTSEEDLFLRTFAVFDRWGNQVFVRRNVPAAPNEGWDGRYQNGDVRSGVYIYLLEFDLDGEIMVARGDVLVIN